MTVVRLFLLVGLLPPFALADKNVAVRALADEDYSNQKFGSGTALRESYVFMQGNYYPGSTVDRSIARISFREIAQRISRDLARQNFVPAKDVNTSDLLIVIHWGTTIPLVSTQELTAKTTFGEDRSNSNAGLARINAEEIDRATDGDATIPNLGNDLGETSDDLDRETEFSGLGMMSDSLALESAIKTNVQLLGYSDELRKTKLNLATTEKERTLRYDIRTERYFIIVRAYDLRPARAGKKVEKPVWTVYLNVASPGNNFTTALTKMGNVGVDFFGRNVDVVTTSRPIDREGTVTIEPAVILGIDE